MVCVYIYIYVQYLFARMHGYSLVFFVYTMYTCVIDLPSLQTPDFLMHLLVVLERHPKGEQAGEPTSSQW